MSASIPSLSLIVDQLTVRIEWAEAQGRCDEAEALSAARHTLVEYVLWEDRKRSILHTILARLGRRYAA